MTRLEPDSGGAGLHRGGNGIHMTYRFLADGESSRSTMTAGLCPYPWGRQWRPSGQAVPEKCSSACRWHHQKSVGNKQDEDVEVREAGELLHFITWGGGGWGDPLERDPELVGLEIRQGLVTEEGARDYGVIADAKGVVDAEATAKMREEMRAARTASDSPFNTGPDIATLRERCEEETGLPAPKQPVWDHHLTAEAAE